MQVERWLQHGPYKIELEEECLCKNNSKGLKCGSCVSGFFDLADSCSRFVTCFYTFVLVLVLFLVGNRARNGWPVLVPVLGHRCSCGSRCQRVPFLSLFSPCSTGMITVEREVPLPVLVFVPSFFYEFLACTVTQQKNNSKTIR